MIVEGDILWQEQWKARVRALAHTWGPREFGTGSRTRQFSRTLGTKTRLTPIPMDDNYMLEEGQTPCIPPRFSLKTRTSETDHDFPTSTVMIPMVQLLQVEVRPTAELVNQAVRLFYERFHKLLPNAVRVGPLRYLAKTQDFYPVLCEDLGCFTVELQYDRWLKGDSIQCVNDFLGVEAVFYL